ncbi:DUF2799 domain-containing protein [Hyphococcus flavus]|uniref:DUF2799 domain-containing protein n=1 Tax=Hyphococcus flavus TaxID=1866326 RepID=A0AAF0CGV1_9PROT|nr:DUF2799 domain-containing protein [Hyphococcus flavus]WDI31152.1 DUF2799 domain-containing protein [Hyphococcus flavus]
MRKFYAPVIALSIVGCAGISKEECLYADWSAVGYEDGAAGRPVSAVSHRRSACAKKAGVTVDMVAYNAGRAEGLKLYCRPSNGYSIGAAGGRYYGVCTDGSERLFLSAYESGRRLFSLEQDVATAEGRLHQAEADLHNTDVAIANTQMALVSPSTPMADRPALLVEMKELYERKEDINAAFPRLNRDLYEAERALADYEDHLAYNGPLPHSATEPTRAGY